MREASSAAHELKEQAFHLTGVVGQFKLDLTHAAVSALPGRAIIQAARAHGGLRLAKG